MSECQKPRFETTLSVPYYALSVLEVRVPFFYSKLIFFLIWNIERVQSDTILSVILVTSQIDNDESVWFFPSIFDGSSLNSLILASGRSIC